MAHQRGRLPKSTDYEPLKYARTYLTNPWPAPTFPVTSQEGIGAGDWGMCGNTTWSNCAQCAEWHLEMATSRSVGKTLAEPKTGTGALRRARLYWGKSVTSPPGPGTVLLTYLKWLMQRKAIKAFAPIDHTDPSELSYFAGVGYGVYLGVNLNPQAETQFNNGQPWQVGPTDQPDPTDGHCVLFDKQTTTAGPFYVITWGKSQQATITWMDACLVNNPTGEAFLVVTNEQPVGRFSATLVADCKELSEAT